MNPIFKRSLVVAAIVAGLAGVSAIAVAQGAGPQGDMHAQHMTQRGQQPDDKQWQERRAERMEKMTKRHAERQAELKNKLKITASQEPAWNTFVSSTMPKPSAQPQKMAREDWSKLTTPERLDRMQAQHAERDQHMKQGADATKALYAALTPEQQKVFDTEAMGRFQRVGMKGERGDARGHGHGRMKDGMGCEGPAPRQG